ncbi:MAG: uncharacterized membrane protein (DUF373 family) [Oceanicoccus sp.]|jgi:uncharacterized membrane protein (DUF373 family)
MKKYAHKIQKKSLDFLEVVSKVIAFTVCIGLLLAAGFVVFDAFHALLTQDVDLAVQDGLFVLILLEMFYVTRSFIRHGSINVAIVINVGVIAAVKEMVFQLDNLNLQMAGAFGIIFTTLSFTYFMERMYYKKLGKGSE